MTIDRRALMNAAWTVARRFARNRETWGQRLSRALKLAWGDAKEAAATAARVAAHAAAQAATLARMATAQLRAAVIDLENCDARLGWERQERLSTRRRELAQRAA